MSGVTLGTLITVTIPLKTVSEANCHTHWRQRQRRAKEQRSAVYVALRNEAWALFDPPASLPCTVTLTRIAPRALDDDNNVSSFKAIRDEVAAFLGVDDRTPLITWQYAQRKGAVRGYSVEITICPGA